MIFNFAKSFLLVFLIWIGGPLAIAQPTTTEETSKIRKKFVVLAAKWQIYCRDNWTCSILDNDACPEYKSLVRLGQPAIPLIMPFVKADRRLDLRNWNFLLEDITGINRAKNAIEIDFDLERQFWLNWWDKQRGKGIHFQSKTTNAKAQKQ